MVGVMNLNVLSNFEVDNMNRAYRVIWSGSSKTWTAVSEHAKGHARSQSHRAVVTSVLSGLLFSIGAFAPQAYGAGLQLCNKTSAQSGTSIGPVKQNSTLSCVGGLTFGLSENYNDDGAGASNSDSTRIVGLQAGSLTVVARTSMDILASGGDLSIKSLAGLTSVQGAKGVYINTEGTGQTIIGGSGVINVQSQKITGVNDAALNATSTEAVAGRQLNATNTTVAAVKSTADKAASDALAAQTQAKTAQTAANAAQATANQAKTDSASAITAANDAKSDAASAKTDAGTALTTANQAKVDAASANTTANDAKADAGTALITANQAKTDAGNAITAANDAKSDSAGAKADAGTALTAANQAKTDAGNAITTANDAKSDAASAKADAGVALSAANQAKTDAGNAITTANDAKTDAAGAKADAGTALTAANQAKTDAGNAIATANDAKSDAAGARADSGTALTAANEAKTDAGNAITTANDAKSDAAGAKADAGVALTAANQAKTDAGNAIATANDAKSDAAGAKADAGVALTAANEAKTDAGNAITTANDAKFDVAKNTTAVANLMQQVGSGEVGLVKQDGQDGAITVAKDHGGDTVNVSGTSGNRRVQGVAAGAVEAASTDAVNGGQVFAVKQQVEKLRAGSAATAVDVSVDGSDAAAVKKGSRGVAVGADSKAQGQAVVAVGAQSSASGDGSVAVGNNASASAPGSVAIGQNAQADRANTVSVGVLGAERQITHVAPATQGTDAVNLEQTLSISRQSSAQTLKDANAYTDSQIGDLRHDAYAGTAAAMAMAALPQVSSAGGSMISLSGSTFEGQSATAIGVSGMSSNGHWIYKASGAATTRGNLGATVGVGYQW